MKYSSKMSLLGFILVSLVFLSSCDPVQSIYVENQTSAPASVLFTFNPGAQDYRFQEAEGADTYLVRLDSTGASQEFYFAMGTWGISSSLDSLVGAVASVELKSERSSESFVGPQQVRAFFTERIKKKSKARIEIVLD